MAVLTVALPAWLCRQWNFPDNLAGEGNGVGFDTTKEVTRLQKQRPRWILIGNSMLNSRLDEKPLAGVAGCNVRILSKGGTQSAVWFLFLKNLVVQSKSQPPVVTIFFRDTDLTWADFRIKGGNEGLIELLDGPAQPEWQEVLAPSAAESRALPARLTQGLSQLFPVSDLRPLARRQMQERAFRLTRIGTRANSSVRRAELNERFSLSHLRHDLGLDFAATGNGSSATGVMEVDGEVIDPGFYEDGPAVFDPSPEASFLPHMIALAQSQGIKLHFHRIKRRPARNHTRPDPPELAAYVQSLKSYLTTQGCLFTDESADLRLTLDLYADGDHISAKPEIQEKYLQIFWEMTEPLILPLLSVSAKTHP